MNSKIASIRSDGHSCALHYYWRWIAETATSIYVDGFVIGGLTEYYLATRNQESLTWRFSIFEVTSPLLRDHSKLATQPHPIPNGLQSHGPSMAFALFNHDLPLATNDTLILDRLWSWPRSS